MISGLSISMPKVAYKHKIQFLKDGYMEEDDFIQMRETLENITYDWNALYGTEDEPWSDDDSDY